MTDNLGINSIKAVQDFRSARNKASLREIIRRFSGESTELLSFEEVRQKLKAQIGQKTELKEISIEAIIGSVNRYQDFDRDFLPGENIDEDRWIKIELANYGPIGLPPIEAYQIGEAYFVSDGNHRVSVAKQLGSKEIQAYVTYVNSRVPLSADIRPEDLILKSEYAEFLDHTNLDELRPGANLSVTVPGQYQVIEEHIAVHRYFMGIEQAREIPSSEAVIDWYDKVYLPVAEIIRDQGLLYDFPNRTETDLYLWIADHRATLEQEIKNQVATTNAAEDLVDQYSQRPDRVIARLGNKIMKTLIPSILETGPAPGEWRQSIITNRRLDCLFAEILVPIDGLEAGWHALEQALIVAKRENAMIHGLHIIEADIDLESAATQEITKEFSRRCADKGIHGELLLRLGDISQQICDQARRNDLVVMNLSFPPDASILGRLSSGIRNLVQKCPRPILFTPQVTEQLDHALLAYDGSQKSQEALFIAAYLALQWKIPLTVLTLGQETIARQIQDGAKEYLKENSVDVNYLIIQGTNKARIIYSQVIDLDINFLLLGGYGHNPIVEVTQGSEVDEILRLTKIPVLVCR